MGGKIKKGWKKRFVTLEEITDQDGAQSFALFIYKTDMKDEDPTTLVKLSKKSTFVLPVSQSELIHCPKGDIDKVFKFAYTSACEVGVSQASKSVSEANQVYFMADSKFEK